MSQYNTSTDVLNNQPICISELPTEERNKLNELNRLAELYCTLGWKVLWEEDKTIYIDEAKQSLMCAIASGLLKPYIDAMQSASGLTRFEAKTCVYYAIATFLCEVYAELFPILLFQGNSGTGKSAAMNQLEKLVNQPKRINGRTYSEIGRDINGTVTAIIDEGDFRQERVEPDLLQLRCSKRYENQVIHMPPQQKPENIRNFGATILARRTPFNDTATRNRTITIKTRRRQRDDYHIVEIDNDNIRIMSEIIGNHIRIVNTSDRVNDAWKPITEIARTIGDNEWLEYQQSELRKAHQMLSVGDQYEPEDVFIKAIMGCCHGNFNHAIKLNDIKSKLENSFDIRWSTQKIHAMSVNLDFNVRFYQGYDNLVANNVHLMELATERGINWEESIE